MSDTGDAEAPITLQYDAIFSSLAEKTTGMGLKWTPWRSKTVVLSRDCFLIVKESPLDGEESERYDLSTIKVTHMNQRAIEDKDNSTKDVGLMLEVKTLTGHETRVRMIITQMQQAQFCEAIRSLFQEDLVIRQVSITSQVITTSQKSKRQQAISDSTSMMRSAIAMAMDEVDIRSKRERIVAKRGVMKWLPVFFSSDMVHGAWWFVAASALFAFSAVIVLHNNDYHHYLGNDDSILSAYWFDVAWSLLLLAGVLFTVGSLVFVRAVHQDPPMKPLLPGYYHVHSDELLGSWLFLLATLPLLPYVVIYLVESHGAYVYILELFGALGVIYVTYLLLRASYPMENPQTQPSSSCLQSCTHAVSRILCMHEVVRQRHLPNGWLAGCWIFFVLCLVATIVFFFITLLDFDQSDALQNFVTITSWIELLWTLIATAYWVAGSYPEEGHPHESTTGHDGGGAVEEGRKPPCKETTTTLNVLHVDEEGGQQRSTTNREPTNVVPESTATNQPSRHDVVAVVDQKDRDSKHSEQYSNGCQNLVCPKRKGTQLTKQTRNGWSGGSDRRQEEEQQGPYRSLFGHVFSHRSTSNSVLSTPLFTDYTSSPASALVTSTTSVTAV